MKTERIIEILHALRHPIKNIDSRPQSPEELNKALDCAIEKVKRMDVIEESLRTRSMRARMASRTSWNKTPTRGNNQRNKK